MKTFLPPLWREKYSSLDTRFHVTIKAHRFKITRISSFEFLLSNYHGPGRPQSTRDSEQKTQLPSRRHTDHRTKGHFLVTNKMGGGSYTDGFSVLYVCSLQCDMGPAT